MKTTKVPTSANPTRRAPASLEDPAVPPVRPVAPCYSTFPSRTVSPVITCPEGKDTLATTRNAAQLT